ncbi:MAG: ThiF family adenylyltransferase [Bdellovibrionia bacterium]
MNFSRNLGLITKEQQAQISDASVLICGVGGMGGVCAEVLVRLGIGKLTIIDPDVFEATNFNRQLHSNQKTIGKYKVDVLKDEYLSINPELKVKSFREGVSMKNVDSLIEGISVVVNGMDQLAPSILIERKAREKGIPIVDAWLTPFASVFTMTPKDPHWEEFLGFPTAGKSLEEITPEDCKVALKKEVDYTFSHSTPFKYIDKALVQDVLDGKISRPSLAPVVWLSGVLMANEAFKLIVGYPPVGPAGVFYDQYVHQLIPGRLSARKP